MSKNTLDGEIVSWSTDKEQQETVSLIRAALIKGENSGKVKTLNPRKFIAEKKEKYRF